MAPAPLLTTDEYLQTPERLPPAEVIFGALRVADSPSIRHQQAVAAFHLALAPHVSTRNLGWVLLAPLDVILDYRRALILQPDLLFVSTARRHIVGDKIVGAPDIVLEVLSPNPRIGKLEERIGWFASYGVREIWLLHQPARRFEVLTVNGGEVVRRDGYDYQTPIRSVVLPAFAPTVQEILQHG